uniref:HAT C-terminal dimerisation domain-containing protein n=1 Tax=Ditylenchus dipsaci TaxID=166011 RepID=A0A915CQC0_9BILA
MIEAEEDLRRTLAGMGGYSSSEEDVLQEEYEEVGERLEVQNPIGYWDSALNTIFRSLATLAMDILAITATSAPIERVFSQARLATSRHRSRTEILLLNSQLSLFLSFAVSSQKQNKWQLQFRMSFSLAIFCFSGFGLLSLYLDAAITSRAKKSDKIQIASCKKKKRKRLSLIQRRRKFPSTIRMTKKNRRILRRHWWLRKLRRTDFCKASKDCHGDERLRKQPAE